MSKVLKSLIIILTFIPVFLDVISPSDSCKRSCRNYEKDPITVYIYDYNGEVYNQVTSQTNIYKNTLLNFTEYDNPTLDGHIFLGWYLVQPHYHEKITVTTLEELEEYPGQIVDKLPTRVSNDSMYFPLLIQEENLTNFLETSDIAKISVEIRLRYPNETKNINVVARLYDTYEDVIKFYLDEEYEYVASSLTNYEYESFIKNIGAENVNVLDTSTKLEYSSYFTVNVYLKEK